MFYIPTKYEEHRRTLLIPDPSIDSSIPSIRKQCRCGVQNIHPSVQSLGAVHALHDFNENPLFSKFSEHRALRVRELEIFKIDIALGASRLLVALFLIKKK